MPNVGPLLKCSPGTFTHVSKATLVTMPIRMPSCHADKAVAELERFWKYLPSAKLEAEGRVLQLVEGTSFFGDARFGSKMFLRPCYDGLEKELQKHWGTGMQTIAILGTPGERQDPHCILIWHHK